MTAHFEDGILEKEPAGLLDQACGGLIGKLLAAGDFQGKLYQVSVLYTGGAMPGRRIVIVGLGKRADFNSEKLRGAYAKAARQVRALNLKEFSLAIDDCLPDQSPSELTEAVVEGALLGLYRFTPYKTVDREIHDGHSGYAYHRGR